MIAKSRYGLSVGSSLSLIGLSTESIVCVATATSPTSVVAMIFCASMTVSSWPGGASAIAGGAVVKMRAAMAMMPNRAFFMREPPEYQVIPLF
ncbi:MAG: hypothetical protein AAB906_02985 [Patescibacteria group bacterium]